MSCSCGNCNEKRYGGCINARPSPLSGVTAGGGRRGTGTHLAAAGGMSFVGGVFDCPPTSLHLVPTQGTFPSQNC